MAICTLEALSFLKTFLVLDWYYHILESTILINLICNLNDYIQLSF